MNNTLCAALLVAIACACSPAAQAQSSYIAAAFSTEMKGMQLAEADLNAILPGGSVGAPLSQPVAAPPAASLQPTFEKWDVLHQYPRYLPASPPAEPRTPAIKPQETPKSSKEHQDA